MNDFRHSDTVKTEYYVQNSAKLPGQQNYNLEADEVVEIPVA